MIFDTVIGIAIAVLNGVLNLIPSWSPPDWSSLGGTIGTTLAAANGYFPLVTLASCLTIVIALRLVMFLWAAVVYVYELIPFKAT